VLTALRKIAEMEGTKSQDKKIQMIQRLLRDAKGPEARFLIRALQGKLRIGLAETTVLIALAHAVLKSPPPNLPCEDIKLPDEVAPLESELKLRNFAKSDKRPYQEVLDLAVSLVKQAYAECSDHGMLAKAILEAPLYAIRRICHLIPGTPVSPMLAKPTKSVDEVLKRLSGQQLTVEFKYDGERMQLHRLANGTVKIFSRSQEDTTQRWPELADSRLWADSVCKPTSGDGTFVLDAEVVAWDTKEKKLLPFQILSTRKRKAEDADENTVQVIVQAFDLLYLDGEPLLRKSLHDRRKAMYDTFFEVEGRFTFAQARDVDLRDPAEREEGSEQAAEEGEQVIAAFMNDAVEGSCEGLMVKTLFGSQATYEPSVRSLNWLKLKKDYMESFGGADSLDLVPIGAYRGKGKRTGVWGAYLLACYDPETEEFQSVCKIGTGFSDEALKDLSTKFASLALPEGKSRPPQYRMGDSLEPDVYFEAQAVWEVRAADLSLSSTHKGAIGKAGIDPGRGVGLRFPRFIRERDDKPATHATSADQIRDMYFEQQSVDSSGQVATAAMDEDDDYI